MPSIFHKDELITKNGKSYPVVGARLRVAHEENDSLEIITDIVSFEVMDQTVVKASVKIEKDVFSAYGVASTSKDLKLIDSLLELAETRAIARALSFAGYGVEYIGIEEIGESSTFNHKQPHSIKEVKGGSVPSQDFIPMTPPQRRAIENIAREKHWDAVKAAQRIVHRENINCLDDLSKKETVQIIGRFKEQMAA